MTEFNHCFTHGLHPLRERMTAPRVSLHCRQPPSRCLKSKEKDQTILQPLRSQTRLTTIQTTEPRNSAYLFRRDGYNLPEFLTSLSVCSEEEKKTHPDHCHHSCFRDDGHHFKMGCVPAALTSFLLVLLLCLTSSGIANSQEVGDSSAMEEMQDAAMLEENTTTTAAAAEVGETMEETAVPEGEEETAVPEGEEETAVPEGEEETAVPEGEEHTETMTSAEGVGETTVAEGRQTGIPIVPLTTEEGGVPLAERVNISVYFETMCPDSRSFILHQVYPVMLSLGGIISLEMLAYGKVVVLPDGLLQCQHGPRECAGNMMITCARNVTADDQDFLNFTRCVMDEMTGMDAGERCANETGVVYTDVLECVNSTQGMIMQSQVGEQQANLRPPLTYVPWVTINGVFTWAQQLAVERNLLLVVCNAYEGVKPPACPVTAR